MTTPTPEAIEAAADSCPGGMFQWSAFGANYMDTYCQGGQLFDADSNTGGEIPCPFCDPAGFWDYEGGDSETIPTCEKCESKLPDHTPLTFHDGAGLTMTAACPTCGDQTMLWREYDFDAPDFKVWESAPRARAATIESEASDV